MGKRLLVAIITIAGATIIGTNWINKYNATLEAEKEKAYQEAYVNAYNDAYEAAYEEAYNYYTQQIDDEMMASTNISEQNDNTSEKTEDNSETNYNIMSNDLIKNFIEGKELAKTGNPKVDAFLSRFYEKIMNGDEYIQFFLDNAEQYGVDTSIVQDLIDLNSKIRIGVIVDSINDFLSNKTEEKSKETE